MQALLEGARHWIQRFTVYGQPNPDGGTRAKHKFQLTREAFHSLANIARYLHVRRGVGKIKLNELPSLRMHTHGKRHQFLAEGTVLMTDSDQLWEKIVP